MRIYVYVLSVLTTAKCRLLYSSHSPSAMCSSRHAELCRRSQSVSAFQTTFYSAVPLPDLHADADVFQTVVPCHHHRHAALDCFESPSTTATRNDLAERHHPQTDLSSKAAVGNGRCPGGDLTEDDGPGRSRLRQRWRHGWAQRAAVLLRAAEGAFFPGSIVALLLTLAVMICVDATAVALDGAVRTLVDVDKLETVVHRGIEDLSASISAFTDFLNDELTSPLCSDHVDLDVLKLSSLLRRRRFGVAGTCTVMGLSRLNIKHLITPRKIKFYWHLLLAYDFFLRDASNKND